MSTSETKPACKSFITKWRLLIAGGVLLWFAPFLAYGSWLSYSAWKVSQLLDQAQARQEPLTLEAAAALEPLPAGVDDVTALWRSGIEPFATKPDEELTMLLYGRQNPYSLAFPFLSQPIEFAAEAEALIEKHRAAMDQLHEAASRGGYGKFPLERTPQGRLFEPMYERLSDVDLHLSTDAYLRGRKGDGEGAARSILTMLRSRRAFRHNASLGCQLCMRGIQERAILALIPLLCSGVFTDAQLAQIDQELRERDADKQLKLALLGERAFALEIFENPSRLGWEEKLSPAWSPEKAVYLELMEKRILNSELGLVKSWDISESLDRDYEVQCLKVIWPRKRRDLESLMRRIYGIEYGLMVGEARVEGAIAAIAFARFRQKYGELPKSLEALSPEFLAKPPIDPFSGKPILFKVDATGVRTYSIGPNQKDDGGTDDMLRRYRDLGEFFPLKDAPPPVTPP